MATRTIPERIPRETLSARFEALGSPSTKGFADYIRAGDAGGPIPCWGALAERFQQDVTKVADREAAWDALIEEGDRRALLLFLHLSRDRPEVMAKVLEDVDRLSPALQRALVSFEEVADQVPAHLDKLAASARQVFQGGADVLAREREQVEARIAQLTTFRYFVPDPQDPANEPGAVKSTAVNLGTEVATLATPALNEVAVTAAVPAAPTEGGG